MARRCRARPPTGSVGSSPAAPRTSSPICGHCAALAAERSISVSNTPTPKPRSPRCAGSRKRCCRGFSRSTPTERAVSGLARRSGALRNPVQLAPDPVERPRDGLGIAHCRYKQRRPRSEDQLRHLEGLRGVPLLDLMRKTLLKIWLPPENRGKNKTGTGGGPAPTHPTC